MPTSMQVSLRAKMHWVWVAVICLPALWAPVAQAQVLGQSPETATPVRSSQGAAPKVLLTMARDHSLFFPAYNDLSDLDGDGAIDFRFKPTFEYLGLYNPYYCYSYSGNNSNLMVGNDDLFTPTATAVATTVNGKTVPGPCVATGQSDKWSGNFLNYITTTRIDALRVALYGGYREVDTTSNTVLRRAYIPQDGHAWAKEYTSYSVDEYYINLYAPLPEPNSGRRHFFGNLTSTVPRGETQWSSQYNQNMPTVGISCGTLSNCSNYPPVLRIITNSDRRVWEWASSERPVLNAIANPTSWMGSVTSYGSGTFHNDYAVRVKVCIDNYRNGCKAYTDANNNITYKPTGVLHDFGENGSLEFGLLTGSYDKNMSGGRLRKSVTSFAGEVSSTTGVFQNSTNSLVKQINNIRIRNFNNPTGSNTIYQNKGRPVPDYTNDYYGNNFIYKNQYDYASGLMVDGNYADWGNPVAEMMFEGLRYFKGAGAASTEYAGTSTEDGTVGLDTPAWVDPYADTTKWCAKPVQVVISGPNPSFDSDQLPGSKFGTVDTTLSNAAGTAIDVQTLANIIGGTNTSGVLGEQINGTYRFVAESYVGGTLIANGSPTAKMVDSLGTIRGLAPDEADKRGSYYAASVAYFGKKSSLRAVNNKNIPTVDTFSLLLNSAFPKITIPFNGGKKITVVPFAKTISQDGGESYNPYGITSTKGDFQPTNQIVGAYVTSLTDPTNANGAYNLQFRVNYEDRAWGGDFEMDAFALYNITATANGLTIVVTPEYQAGSARQNMGYVISGTDGKDGAYLVAQDENNSYSFHLNVPPGQLPGYCDAVNIPQSCNTLPNISGAQNFKSSSVSFTPAANPSDYTLKDPLWYAAKWGGYPDGIPPTGPSNSDPDHYAQVTSPARLKAAFALMFQAVLDNSATQGTVTSSSQQLRTTSQIFTTSYNAKTYLGELTATNFTVTQGASSDTISYTDAWSANAQLPTAANRNIYYKRLTDGTLNAFTDINVSTDYSGKFSSSDVLNYIRGARDKEQYNGGTLRNRVSVLGTTINSTPVYSQDTGMVYLGANDGMLHAFDAGTGVEKFAYIPTSLLTSTVTINGTAGRSVLGLLSTTDFTGRYYVDGNIAVSDKNITGGINYLVGFLGRGGKGLFGLQVSAASGAGTGIKTDGGVWENFGTGDDDLGYLLGVPLIEQLANGTNVVIFGNGYNSTNNKAVLYVVRLSDGVVLGKYSTNTGSTGGSTSNGLATPTVVRSNGKVQYVYAGDYLGNVWKFDLRNQTSSVAPGTTLAARTTSYDSNSSTSLINKLFRAVRGDGTAQRIVAPLATSYSYNSSDPLVANKRFVFFGTGSDLTQSDISNSSGQTMYGLIDTGGNNTQISSDRTALRQRSLNTGAGSYSAYKVNQSVGVRSFSAWAADDMNGKLGWYMDWSIPGGGSAAEQVFSQANVRPATTPTLVVSSNIVNNNSCTTTGAGYLNAMDAYHGGSLTQSYFDINRNGSATDETFIPTGGAAKVISSIDFGVGTIGQSGTTGDNVIVQGSGVNTGQNSNNTADVGTKKFTKVSRRISWREIVK